MSGGGMPDTTVIYITASEMPERWMEFQLGHLHKAIEGKPIISVSRKPMDLGINLIDSEPKSYWNIYVQMLRAAKFAKTPYVAMAEDDTLYTKAHFNEFRPPLDKVSYDRSRWSLFTWDNMYCMRQRISNCSLISPTDLLIDAMEERQSVWPDGAPNELVGEVGREKVDKRMKVTVRGMVEWYCNDPIVQLNHPTGTDKGYQTDKHGRYMVKKHGQMKAFDIPYWGKASDIIKAYNG
jgi:hypothetical protein